MTLYEKSYLAAISSVVVVRMAFEVLPLFSL